MEKVKKIILQKSDEPTLVAEKLIDADSDTVVFVIPKFSKFGDSVSNFKLIKREADVLKKKVIIESVDEEVVSLAKKTGLEALNPFFSRSSKNQPKISDIIVKKRVTKRAVPAPAPIVTEVAPTQEQLVHDAAPVKSVMPEATEEVIEEPVLRRQSRREKQPRDWFSRKTLVWAGVVVIVFGLFPYLALAVLPRADIQIQREREPWNYKGAIAVDKNLAAYESSSGRIPGQVFTESLTMDMQFPASGEKDIAKKAAGRITIYNAFNSAPQALVASTRFEAPDGKIFRLASGVTVPGARIDNGQVVPSSVVADVVADKPGPAYNVGPIAKLTIPGFAGTPRFNGFYGEIKEALTGGFIGRAKVATEADVASAKTKANKAVEEAVRTRLTSGMPEQFKVIEGASKFEIVKQTIQDRADDKGQFSIFTDAKITVVAFVEKDLLSALHERIKSEKVEAYEVKNESIDYGAARLDAASGRMTFAVDYAAQLVRDLDEEKLIDQVQGQSEAGLKAIVAALPGVEKAKLSLWPIWVHHVPKSESKIELEID